MKVTAVTQRIAIALYSLPFLGIVVFSLFFVWAGSLETIVTGIALLPAVLYFFGLQWCRYLVGVFSALCVFAAIARAMPALTMNQGRYFWLIWSPLFFVFASSAIASFIPVRPKSVKAAR